MSKWAKKRRHAARHKLEAPSASEMSLDPETSAGQSVFPTMLAVQTPTLRSGPSGTLRSSVPSEAATYEGAISVASAIYTTANQLDGGDGYFYDYECGAALQPLYTLATGN